jgi:dipeptidyl aminopeptidase/acylaminoacyl peptidase
MSKAFDSKSLAEAIVDASSLADVTISPNREQVAWTARLYGMSGENPVSTIWIAPTDGSTEGRSYTPSDCLNQRPAWSPDGSAVAFLSDRSEAGTPGLYLLPTDGGEARKLVQRKSSIESFSWSPDGRTIAFTSPDELSEEETRRKDERDDADVYGESWPNAGLYLLDLESEQVTRLPSGDFHTREIAWSPGGDRIAFLASPTPELETQRLSKLFTIGRDSSEPELVADLGSWVSASLVWTTSGTHLCFLSAHEAILSALTVYAVESSGGTPRIIGPSSTEEMCALRIIKVAGEDRILAAMATGLTTQLEWIDPATSQREPLYNSGAGDIEPASFDVCQRDSGALIATVFSTGSQPPEVHVGTPDRLTRISSHNSGLLAFSFGQQEPFTWTSADGLELDGLLIRPPDAGDEPLPTVVHIHGGPYGRYSAGWNLRPGHWAQWLAAHGYAVLMPNYRGGAGHGNDFASWAHGGVGDMEFVDIMTAVDAAVERGIADPDRLGIGGWSQGGFLTAWAVTQTDRFKAGVMGAGVSDWGMMVMTSDIPTVESMLGGGKPWDGAGPHRFMQHSPISHARNAKTPLLMLHGKEDPRVPVSQAIGYHRALVENGVATELVTYPREPHGFRERTHQIDSFIRVRDWFQRYL